MSAANLPKKASIETILAQAGIRYQEITSISSRDIIPPLHLSTTFERDIDGTYSNGFVYSRHDHPTRALLEKGGSNAERRKIHFSNPSLPPSLPLFFLPVMTDIEEGAEWSAAFASGMQAATVLLQAFGANAYLILPNDLYQGIRVLVRSTFEEWGLRNECVDMTDLGAVKEIMDRVFADAGTSRVLVWMESPSNPLLKVGKEEGKNEGRGSEGGNKIDERQPCVIFSFSFSLIPFFRSLMSGQLWPLQGIIARSTEKIFCPSLTPPGTRPSSFKPSFPSVSTSRTEVPPNSSAVIPTSWPVLLRVENARP